MTNRQQFKDRARDEETIQETRRAHGEMENVEYDFFKRRTATWEDVVKARDEYLDAWEDRRNFRLSEKFDMSPEELETAMNEYEASRV